MESGIEKCLNTIFVSPRFLFFCDHLKRKENNFIFIVSILLQMIETPLAGNQTTDSYAAYADNFDLSLLPDSDLATSIEHSIQTQQQQQQLDLMNSDNQLSPRSVTPDYIPTTISSAVFNSTKNSNNNNNNKSNEINPMLKSQLNNSKVEEQQQPSQSDISSCEVFQSFDNKFSYFNSLSPPQEQFLTIFPPSPTPSIEFNCNLNIKKEQHNNTNFGLYPPSPPDSNGAPSPIGYSFGDIKSEPYDISSTEQSINFNTLFDQSFRNLANAISPVTVLESPLQQQQQQQQLNQKKDHQLLREYLQDTTFQKKHNLKPLALESLFVGDWGARGDIEPVISLALEHARKDVLQTCIELNISAGTFYILF